MDEKGGAVDEEEARGGWADYRASASKTQTKKKNTKNGDEKRDTYTAIFDGAECVTLMYGGVSGMASAKWAACASVSLALLRFGHRFFFFLFLFLFLFFLFCFLFIMFCKKTCANPRGGKQRLDRGLPQALPVYVGNVSHYFSPLGTFPRAVR